MGIEMRDALGRRRTLDRFGFPAFTSRKSTRLRMNPYVTEGTPDRRNVRGGHRTRWRGLGGKAARRRAAAGYVGVLLARDQ